MLSNRRAEIVVIALGILLVFLFAAGFSTMRDIRHLRAEGLLKGSSSSMERVKPSEIRGWMTFDYINRTHGLPPSLLLAVSGGDHRYPKLTIGEAAEVRKSSPISLIEEINALIASYRTAR